FPSMCSLAGVLRWSKAKCAAVTARVWWRWAAGSSGSVAAHVAGELAAAGDPEFRVHPAQMPFDGAHRQDQCLGDGAVARALGDQQGDLTLTPAELDRLVRYRREMRRGEAVGQRVDHPGPGQRRACQVVDLLLGAQGGGLDESLDG